MQGLHNDFFFLTGRREEEGKRSSSYTACLPTRYKIGWQIQLLPTRTALHSENLVLAIRQTDGHSRWRSESEKGKEEYGEEGGKMGMGVMHCGHFQV